MKETKEALAVVVSEIDGKAILAAHPKLQGALADFAQGYGDTLNRMRSVVSELVNANLNPREQTAVLLEFGLEKSFASRIKSLANDTPEHLRLFLEGKYTVRMALKVAQSGVDLPPVVPLVKVNGNLKELDSLLCEAVNRCSLKLLPKSKAVWKGERLGCKVVIHFSPVSRPGPKGKGGKSVNKKKAAGVSAGQLEIEETKKHE